MANYLDTLVQSVVPPEVVRAFTTRLPCDRGLFADIIPIDTLEWRPVLPDQVIGIEVEVEEVPYSKVNDFIPSQYIKTTEDGSLRNHGLEYITCPHNTSTTETLLKALYAKMPSTRNFTARTSLHVHFNVLDMTIGQVLSLMYAYTAVEKLLYQWVGHGRDRSIFCVPLCETTVLRNLEEILMKGKFKSLPWMKYTGLNLLPITQLGTIEFRHMYGCEKVEPILEWINLLLCLFRYAKNTHPTLAHDRIISLNSNSEYMAFLEEVFQEQARVLVTSKFEKRMEAGISHLKAYVFHNPYWAYLRKSTSLEGKLIERYKVICPNSVYSAKVPIAAVNWDIDYTSSLTISKYMEPVTKKSPVKNIPPTPVSPEESVIQPDGSRYFYYSDQHLKIDNNGFYYI